MVTELHFYKFDGAGNDFVVVDNRTLHWQPTEDEVYRLCHRRFGVGADGLMTLDVASDEYDFEMHYYNSDGRLGSMCGNGGRCIAAFAYLLKLPTTHYPLPTQYHFKGYDGPHDAEVLSWEKGAGVVRLGMRSVAKTEVRPVLNGWFINTGSPHYVQYVKDLEHFDVVGEGRRIRHLSNLFPSGTNVDFIEERPDGRLAIRTYERGVEDETWACGTGVTAVALVTGHHGVVARGGEFTVDFVSSETAFTEVHLTGPVSLNFTGTWTFSAQ